jgi:V8-like Glu-specific endopeptidase
MRGVILTAILAFSVFVVNGQISKGGKPLKVPVLKSRGIPVMEMPRVINADLFRLAEEERKAEPFLKSFRFAHSFDVHISPETEGLWISDAGGYDVWVLKLRSEGAFSINIIFGEFHLPEGTRLFLFNEKERYYLGAYTSANNKKFRKFAVSPVPGDEITIQYEVPSGMADRYNFIIKQVNHDFTGILKYDEYRPSGQLPGDCHIDINCDVAKGWSDVKDAVCRFIVGSDICTGTLVNNTAEDETPYLITAAHCFKRPKDSEAAVFTFNYESPYCAALEGDPSNSISGAFMRAYSDSLDFALVELTLAPPAEFRPYFAGWNNSGNIPDSTVTIHQPEGHLKKISFDHDKPVIYDVGSSRYIKNGFLKIIEWDMGVTENGSSGGALFDPSHNVIGTLTGGDALCGYPYNDYFARFDLAWNFRPDASRQLKYWLDPLNTGVSRLDGRRFNVGEDLCLAFTNLDDEDLHENVNMIDSEQFAGYWGGTNSAGIMAIAERFSVKGNEQLFGVSLGIGKMVLNDSKSGSQISVKVYNGGTLPEELIHSQLVNISTLHQGSMNFIQFNGTVEPADTFFVGIELTGIQPADTFVLFQSVRMPGKENSFYFLEGGLWYDFSQENTGNYSMANVMELVACNVDVMVNDTPLVNNPEDALIYPNPAGKIFTFEAGRDIDVNDLEVFNILGQAVKVNYSTPRGRRVRIDMSGNLPGVYFIRFRTVTGTIVKKVSYIPWY